MPNNIIILDTSFPQYIDISNFLSCIAEPLSRPKHIHIWKLSPESLFSSELKTKDIETILVNISKNKIPHNVKKLIDENTSKYERGRLFLKDNN